MDRKNKMTSVENFIQKLSLVAIKDNKIVGYILFTKIKTALHLLDSIVYRLTNGVFLRRRRSAAQKPRRPLLNSHTAAEFGTPSACTGGCGGRFPGTGPPWSGCSQTASRLQ